MPGRKSPRQDKVKAFWGTMDREKIGFREHYFKTRPRMGDKRYDELLAARDYFAVRIGSFEFLEKKYAKEAKSVKNGKWTLDEIRQMSDDFEKHRALRNAQKFFGYSLRAINAGIKKLRATSMHIRNNIILHRNFFRLEDMARNLEAQLEKNSKEIGVLAEQRRQITSGLNATTKMLKLGRN